jgi:KaiC/GvpD/RAD55 family RecA-like ATPase
MQRALKGAKEWSKVRGSSATCPHPKHDDHEPSGSIKVGDDGIVRFSCHGCDFHGDIFAVLAVIQNKAPGDVLAEVRERDSGTGTTHRPAPTPSAPAKKPARTFKTYEQLRATVDAEKRTRFRATFEAAHPYENPDTGRADLLILRYRKPPAPGQTKGKKDMPQFHQRPDGVWVEGKPPGKQPMYRRKENRGAKTILLLEGEVKVDTLLAMGFNATCWPGGSGAVEEADFDWLDSVERVTVWPDNDDAGRVAMKKAAARISHLPNPPEIAWIEPTDFELEQGEDVVDLIAKCKREGTDPKEVISGAVANARTSNLSEGLRDRFEEIIGGRWYALSLLFPLLSRLSKALLPQNVCIVAGRPGAVKSFFVLRILLYWFQQAVRFAYLSLEEDRTFVNWRLVAMLERNGNLLDDEWVKTHPDESRAAYERHSRELNRFNCCVWERPGEQVTLEWVTEWIRNRAHEGYRVIVVDPITVCRPAAQPWIVDHQFVSAAEHILSTCNTSLLLVSHCAKGAQLLDLDSIAGGAAYQRLCQSLLLLERHKPAKQVAMMNPDINMGRFQCRIDETVHICKARKGKGQGMSIGYVIDWGTMEFSEQGVVVKKESRRVES